VTTPAGARPLTKNERKKYNRAQHEKKIQADLIAQHGPELGNFYFWLRVMNIRGTQLHREGEGRFIRDAALAMENVYRRHFG
jgi:hypothetical protein